MLSGGKRGKPDWRVLPVVMVVITRVIERVLVMNGTRRHSLSVAGICNVASM